MRSPCQASGAPDAQACLEQDPRLDERTKLESNSAKKTTEKKIPNAYTRGNTKKEMMDD